MLKKFSIGLCMFASLHQVASAGLLSSLAFNTHTRDMIASATGQATATTQVSANGAQIEVAFSPRQGAEELVIKAINSAKSEIRIQSYSFTSATITRALLNAKARGVNIALVADYKNNIQQDASGKAKHALSALVNAGISVRTISIYPIHHDKTMVIDRRHVETGSFNYSDAAANKNSENVIVIWNNPELAATYLRHWEDRYSRGQDFQMSY